MTKTNLKILLVEDNKGDIRLLEEILANDAATVYNISVAESLSEALKRTQSEKLQLRMICGFLIPDCRSSIFI